jgi:putative IMPACT (imprinted ancient) family translation regulator
VVRYFGGTKLGVPGLIRAYRSATSDAIENAEVVEKIAGKMVTFTFDYLQMNGAMKLIKDYSAEIINQNFDNICSITVKIRMRDQERFCNELETISNKIE